MGTRLGRARNSGTRHPPITPLLSTKVPSRKIIARPVRLTFFDSSTAANSTILNNGGGTFFFANSTADHAAITCDGGTVAQPAGGTVGLESGSGGNAVFTLNGTDARGATGGSFFMLYAATTATATLIANGGQVAGGLIRFEDGATGGNARIELFDNGKFDISVINNPVPVTTGSLEGDGLVFLGIKNLSVGGNSLSTTFSGVISDGGEEGGVGGSLTKVDSGSLELSGVNTYTGGTTVSAGTLIVSNTTGSATGTGAVSVNAGTLGGSGIIFGAVTVNSGAFLAPAHGTKTQSTLTIQSRAHLQFRLDLHLHLQSQGKAGEDGQGDCQRSHDQQRSDLEPERDDQRDV